MLNLSSQENKSDFGEQCGEKKKNRRKATEGPPGRKNHRSLLQRSIPGGRGGFPSLGVLSARRGPTAAPGTAAGRVERPSLGEAAAAAAQPTSGRRILGGRGGAGGKRRAKSKRAARASVRTKPVAASGRRRGQGGQLGRDPEQSHGSNEMNDGGDGFLSFRY